MIAFVLRTGKGATAYLPQTFRFKQVIHFRVGDVNSVQNGLQVVSAVYLYGEVKSMTCRKRKTRDFSGIISYPLKPPSGANFTTEQISCKSMVHHEPWARSRFICSLPAVYRSCAFHICPRYPALKCLTPMASLLILLSGNVSHCVPLCRVLVTAIRCLPLRRNWKQIWRLSARRPAPKSTDSKYGFIPSIAGWTMGSKTVQVKAPGSQSFPGTAYISPQCGLEILFRRGRFCSNGVVIGVMLCWLPYLSIVA